MKHNAIKTVRYRGLLSSALLFQLFVIPTLFAQSGTDRDCQLSMGWEPFSYFQFVDADGRLTGFDIELVRLVAEVMQCDLELRLVNWARGLADIKSGKLDLLASADYSDERAVWAHFSDSYRMDNQIVLARKGVSKKYPFDSLDDLIGTDFRLGVGRGVYTGDTFLELMKDPAFNQQIFLIPTHDIEQQYNMLLANRFDAFLRSFHSIHTLQEIYGDELDLEIHPIHSHESPQYVMFSRASVNDGQVHEFNLALEQLRNDGSYDAVKERFPH